MRALVSLFFQASDIGPLGRCPKDIIRSLDQEAMELEKSASFFNLEFKTKKRKKWKHNQKRAKKKRKKEKRPCKLS